MSGKDGKILVVGADGLIGRRLVPFIRGKGHDVVGTTRRRETIGPDRQYLDLANAEAFRPPAGTAAAILLAAAASYEECEKNPASAKVNLEGVPTVARRLLDAGVFTVFVSSFTVFGGSLEYPGEEETPRPTIAYGRHKAEGETMLRNAAAATGTG